MYNRLSVVRVKMEAKELMLLYPVTVKNAMPGFQLYISIIKRPTVYPRLRIGAM